MHLPIHTPGQAPGAIPLEACEAIAPEPSAYSTAQPVAQPQSPQHDYQRCYGQLQQQTAQQCHSLSASMYQHSAILDAVGDQSLRSWYNCREAASLTRQQAFAAVDRATAVEQEIAQLNRKIHQQLQQFDAQLKISSQTLRQEVAQKVGQYHRHMQQQSNHCRNRLNLDHQDQPAWTSAHRHQAQRLFDSTTLR